MTRQVSPMQWQSRQWYAGSSDNDANEHVVVLTTERHSFGGAEGKAVKEGKKDVPLDRGRMQDLARQRWEPRGTVVS